MRRHLEERREKVCCCCCDSISVANSSQVSLHISCLKIKQRLKEGQEGEMRGREKRGKERRGGEGDIRVRWICFCAFL